MRSHIWASSGCPTSAVPRRAPSPHVEMQREAVTVLAGPDGLAGAIRSDDDDEPRSAHDASRGCASRGLRVMVPSGA